jgi:acetate kinase
MPAPDEPMPAEMLILTINGGSSSIKFALFTPTDPPRRTLHGQIERIGQPDSRLIAKGSGDSADEIRPIDAGSYRGAAENLVKYLRERLGKSTIMGIGHRVVHGGERLVDHQIITREVVAELRRTQPLDLAHLPREIALIETFGDSFASAVQVACFDTAFHRDLPRVATILPIPRHYHDEGIRRFGFHGLSYTYLMKRLGEIAGKTAAEGKVILAHLGSGASMAAVKLGKSIDTTMGFTPTAGLVMGTRPGDLDPGLLVYLMRVEKLSPDQMDEFISSKCGMLGISETSSDMRDLLQRRGKDERAADAVDIFCYQAKKFVAALAAAMGGLDTLVFSGGIGENAPEARTGICDGLSYMGVKLDSARNTGNADIISADDSPVMVRRIATDEEIVIAQVVYVFVKSGKRSAGKT